MRKNGKTWLTNDEVTNAKAIVIGLRSRRDFDLTDAAACVGDAADLSVRAAAMEVLRILERDGCIRKIKEFDNKKQPLKGGAVWEFGIPVMFDGGIQ